MQPAPRHYLISWIVILLVCVSVALFAPGAYTDETTEITGAPRGWTPPVEATAPALGTLALSSPADAVEPPAEAQWLNGDLLAPLPADPAARADAIAQAMSNGAARAMPVGGVQHTTGAAVGESSPRAGTFSTEDNLPRVKPYVPAEERNGKRSFNLKLPDQFKADPAVLRGVDPKTGKALSQAEQDQAVTAAFAPALQQSWEGIAQTNLAPPDCDAATGPNHVVAVVNARFAIYDKCGTNRYENDLATFVGNSTDFFFDPHVIYDIWSARWYVSVCVRNNTSQNSWVLLLWSDDSDPIGGWSWQYFDFRNLGTASNFWADYDEIGTDANGIYISANMFDWSTPNRIFQYSKLLCIDTADLLDGGGWCGWVFWNMNNPGDGSKAFALQPTTMWTWPGFHWIVNSVSYGASFITLWKVSGTICTGPTLTGYNIPTSTYDDPPAGQQPNGTYVDCGDARLLNAVYANANIWTAHGIRYNWGEAVDRSNIQVFQFNPNTLVLNFEGSFGASGLYYCYPAVDFDSAYNGLVVFGRWGPSESPGSRYVDLGNGGGWGGSSLLASGATSYQGSSDAGTAADPYRWGDYYGAARDPFDARTIWMYGEYDVSTFNWGTRIGAAAPQGAGVLTVTPSPGLVAGGLQGGPFSPGSVNYTLTNTGNSALTWTLSGVASWNTASSGGGQLGAGQATVVNVAINSGANAFTPGTYVDSYTFSNCFGGANYVRSTTLYVAPDGSCDGSVVSLTPNVAPPNYGADGSNHERGVFITAIKDFNICALGYKLSLGGLPRTLTARIYAANGLTRGPLLATGSISIAKQGNVVHYVPVNYTLQACEDYEVTFDITAGDAWEWWNENNITEPFDVGGAVRVRCGTSDGGTGNFALPPISMIGTAVPNPGNVADLGGPGSPPNTAGDDNQQRGIYIRALDTAQLCAFGWEVDLPIGTKLTASVYSATGTTRGALIATGTYTSTAAGLRFHDVPVNVQLEEGRDYDLSISFGTTNSWKWWSELSITEPFDSQVFRVVDAHLNGAAGNSALPHYRATWENKTGGSPFDLRKITDVLPPPNNAPNDNLSYGAYVTANISQELYSAGWMADVPAGQPITARVYAAAGNVRGALISQGTVLSSGDGMRFHDVPLAVELSAGSDYDIAFEWGTVTLWQWWSDLTGMPYTINGVITVRNGEAAGNAGNSALIYMRMHSCDRFATPVVEGPQKTPFFIATPAPNPVSGTARLNYSLEEDGPVTITVYDVAGRRVQTLIDNQHTPRGWHAVDLNSAGYASGVYFLKMQTKAQSVSRKFVVTH